MYYLLHLNTARKTNFNKNNSFVILSQDVMIKLRLTVSHVEGVTLTFKKYVLLFCQVN